MHPEPEFPLTSSRAGSILFVVGNILILESKNPPKIPLHVFTCIMEQVGLLSSPESLS